MGKTNSIEKRQITLMLTVGQEHELLTTQKIDDPNALMYPAYQQAVRALKEIVDSAKRWHKAQGQCPNSRNALYGYANNTIAFCGSRGQGKTSAMLSFCNALNKKVSVSRDLDTDSVIADNLFYVMDPIDPTMLKKGGHITEIVLSYLYTKMKEQLSRGEGAGFSSKEKETLLREFQQAFGWLRSPSSSDRQDDFDDYEKLGHGFDIKETLYHLIETYLALRSGIYESCGFRSAHTHGENCFLVIPLDDIDLQLQNSYDMLEELRQYLQLPNTVVLMAADIGQLRNMTNLHYRREMAPAADCELMDATAFRRLAAKYMDKLIPASQMVYLPEYRLSFRNGEEIMVQIIDEAADSSAEPQELHENLFDLIFRKTGLVFLKHESYLHNLIPTTLRGLRQLYRLLNTMPDPAPLPTLPIDILKGLSSADDAAKEHIRAEANRAMYEYLAERLRRAYQQGQNLSIFKAYFMGDWCASKLDDESEKVLCTISHSAIPTAYAAALEALNGWYRKNFPGPDKTSSSSDDKPSPSDDDKLSPYSALCHTLNTLTEKGIDKAYLLAFAVHTLFSIQFTEEALLEQQRQIEDELKRAELSDLANAFRFGLAYSNLKKRFDDCLLNKSALQFLCDDCDNDTVHMAEEALNGYVKLLNFSKSNLSNYVSHTKLWQYWDAQDWAVLICCNWELQERVLKDFVLLSEKGRSTTVPVSINELNGKLLERCPLCHWGSDAQKELIKTEFASFLPKSSGAYLDTNHAEPSDDESKNAGQIVLDQITLIQRSVQNYTRSKSERRKRGIQEKAENLTTTVSILRTHISFDLYGQLITLCGELSAGDSINEETVIKLGDLRTQLRKELGLSGQQRVKVSHSTEEK